MAEEVELLTVEDVRPLAPEGTTDDALQIYIDDVVADAMSEAPCIADPEFVHTAALKGLLRQAVLRWAKLGEGQKTSHSITAGSFSLQEGFATPAANSAGRLLPREISKLRQWCKALERPVNRRQAFSYMPGQKRRVR